MAIMFLVRDAASSPHIDPSYTFGLVVYTGALCVIRGSDVVVTGRAGDMEGYG